MLSQCFCEIYPTKPCNLQRYFFSSVTDWNGHISASKSTFKISPSYIILLPNFQVPRLTIDPHHKPRTEHYSSMITANHCTAANVTRLSQQTKLRQNLLHSCGLLAELDVVERCRSDRLGVYESGGQARLQGGAEVKVWLNKEIWGAKKSWIKYLEL